MSAAEQLQILFQGDDQLSPAAAKATMSMEQFRQSLIDAGVAPEYLSKNLESLAAAEGIAANGAKVAGDEIRNAGEKAKEAEGGFGVFTASIERMQAMALGFAEGEFIVKGMEAIIEIIPHALEKIESLGDATRQMMLMTGASAESASELLGVMSRFGIEGGQAATALAIFEKHLAGLDESGGKFAATMADMGVQTEDAAGKMRPAIDVMLDFADGIKAMGPGVEAMGAISDAFSVRAGKNFVEFFMQGKQGIQELMALQKQYGAYLSEENVQELYQDEQAHKSLDAAVTGLQVTLGMKLMPVLTDVVKGLTLFTAAIGDASKGSDGLNESIGKTDWTPLEKFSAMADAMGREVVAVLGIVGDSFGAATKMIGNYAEILKSGDLSKGIEEAKRIGDEYGASMQKNFDAIGSAAGKAHDDFMRAQQGISDAAKDTETAEREHLAATAKAYGDLNKAIEKEAKDHDREMELTDRSIEKAHADAADQRLANEKSLFDHVTDLNHRTEESYQKAQEGEAAANKESAYKRGEEESKLADRIADLQKAELTKLQDAKDKEVEAEQASANKRLAVQTDLADNLADLNARGADALTKVDDDLAQKHAENADKRAQAETDLHSKLTQMAQDQFNTEQGFIQKRVDAEQAANDAIANARESLEQKLAGIAEKYGPKKGVAVGLKKEELDELKALQEKYGADIEAMQKRLDSLNVYAASGPSVEKDVLAKLLADTKASKDKETAVATDAYKKQEDAAKDALAKKEAAIGKEQMAEEYKYLQAKQAEIDRTEKTIAETNKRDQAADIAAGKERTRIQTEHDKAIEAAQDAAAKRITALNEEDHTRETHYLASIKRIDDESKDAIQKQQDATRDRETQMDHEGGIRHQKYLDALKDIYDQATYDRDQSIKGANEKLTGINKAEDQRVTDAHTRWKDYEHNTLQPEIDKVIELRDKYQELQGKIDHANATAAQTPTTPGGRGAGTGSDSNLPHFAEGGYTGGYSGPAIVHPDEYVVKGSEMRAGGGNVTIHLTVQGSVVTKDDLVRGIREALAYENNRGVTAFNVNGL